MKGVDGEVSLEVPSNPNHRRLTLSLPRSVNMADVAHSCPWAVRAAHRVPSPGAVLPEPCLCSGRLHASYERQGNVLAPIFRTGLKEQLPLVSLGASGRECPSFGFLGSPALPEPLFPEQGARMGSAGDAPLVLSGSCSVSLWVATLSGPLLSVSVGACDCSCGLSRLGCKVTRWSAHPHQSFSLSLVSGGSERLVPG